jgi:NADH:ubiquinone reductase (H+-translocating)
METKKRVIIIGAGFAGLKAAQALAKKPVEVILIDRNNYHTFTPLLYQVATSGLDPSAVAYPVRTIFAQNPNVRFLMGEVTAIDTEKQSITVQTNSNGIREEAYDTLFVAAGSKVNFFGNESVAKNSFPLRDLDDALSIRNHVLRLFEKAAWTDDKARREALMTIVVVGGGPTGLETAGALYELYNGVLDKDYDKDDNMQARVVLVEAADKLLLPYPPKLQESAKKQLEAIGVEVRLNTMVEDVGTDYVKLRDGESIKTNTVIWSTGVIGSPIARMLAVELDKAGRIPVKDTLEVIGLKNVFAAGDIAYLIQPETNQPYPGLILIAQQEAEVVAKNILHGLKGETYETFRYYDRGIMATIGRTRAVAWLFNKIQLSGFLAWMTWLGFHLIVLMGMRNRVQVFINWVWDYLFYDSSVRIIVEGEKRKLKEKEAR